MYGYPYKVARNNVATSTAISVIQLKVPTTCMAALTRLEATSAAVVDSQVRLQILIKSAAATVTSQTPQPMSASASAPASLCVGGTSATGITASAEGTDGAELWSELVNPRLGYNELWTPEEHIKVPPGTIIAVKFPASQTSVVWNIELSYVEFV